MWARTAKPPPMVSSLVQVAGSRATARTACCASRSRPLSASHSASVTLVRRQVAAQSTGPVGSPPPVGSTGLYHLAILYPTRAALADAMRRLRRAGIPLDGASDHGVSEALYLRDPDNNGIELYWDPATRCLAPECRQFREHVHETASD